MEMYKAAFRKSPIIQIITDEDNIIRDVNDKFLEYFKYDRENVLNQHIAIILASSEEVLSGGRNQFLKETKPQYPNIWEVQTKDDKLRFIAIETLELKDDLNLTTAFDLTKEGYRARQNSVNIKELKKYLVNHG